MSICIISPVYCSLDAAHACGDVQSVCNLSDGEEDIDIGEIEQVGMSTV